MTDHTEERDAFDLAYQCAVDNGWTSTKELARYIWNKAVAQQEVRQEAQHKPVGHVFTMQPCFPGEPMRAHPQLHVALPAGTKLYAEPQPGPDVRALVSADEVRDACANAVSVFADEESAAQCREVAEYMREVILAQIAHRQAQRQA